MSILTVNGITKYFGSEKILESVSFSVDRTDRIGFVGRNGGGKSTLLSIISGREEPDSGAIYVASGTRIGFLTQDPPYGPDNSIWDEVKGVLSYVFRIEERLRLAEADLESASASGQNLEEAMSRYTRTEEEFRRVGGYDWHVSLSTVLTGLGFSTDEFNQRMKTLSSGQRVRVALARILIEKPDVLLLDEPTNHLDIDAAEWLEDRLKSYDGAVIAVSHDRFFLNAACNRIIDLENFSVSEYRGNYDAFVQQKAFKFEQMGREYEKFVKKSEDLKDYVRRYMASERSKMAKSRLKWLVRLGTVERPRQEKNVSIRFKPDSELGKTVFRAKDLSKWYGSRPVLLGVNFTVLGQDRVGIIGKNGAGKTTLLKTIMGLEQPSTGSVWIGPSADIGYFWQDLDALTPENTVIEELMADSDLLPGEARGLLGRFLFSGDDVYKKVSVLSGGEKNRLTLAKLVLSGCNVLVLDEPTNHLDMEAKEALSRALVDFPGCVVFVTHDRQFLQDTATKIFEIAEHSVAAYPGDYVKYREEKAKRALLAAEVKKAQDEELARKERESPQTGRSAGQARRGDPVRRELQKKAHEKAVAAVERDIERLEIQLKDLESRLSDPETYRLGESLDVIGEHKKAEEALRGKYEEWEKLDKNPPE